MLQATMSRDTATASTTPTTPTPPPPKSGTLVAFPTAQLYTKTPTTTAPSKADPLVTRQIKQVLVATAPYSCVNNVCTATGQMGFTFQTLQSLINMANKKLGNAAIAVDGKIDQRTLTAYLPITRAVGGTLAVFDFTPTVDWLAKNADAFARALALWLNMTWVEATPDVPGHWERLRAGQTTVNLPTMPTAPQPQPGMVMQPMEPSQPSTPPPSSTPPPTTMVMYVCPDGTRVSDMSACPVTPPPNVTPPPSATPPPMPTSPAVQPPGWQPSTPAPIVRDHRTETVTETTTTTASGRYAGCIARFNRTRKVYSIYCPAGSAGATPGLGAAYGEYFRCLRGNCVGLGETTVTPPPPSGFVKAAEVTTLPGAGETPAGEERDKFWRLGNPLMWAAIAGAATVVGGGSYMIYRRKRSV